MNPTDTFKTLASRRTFLHRGGLGTIALATLMEPSPLHPSPNGRGAGGEGSRGLQGLPHHAARAKRVIYLYMAGGPSHLETFDHKPKLTELHGQPMPESITAGQPIAQLQGQKLFCFAPQHPFRKFGQSGQEMCELFPRLGEVADDLCIVRSLHTEAINHDPAHTFMNTGTTISGRPSMGSWIWYGLGSTADDLPGFIVLQSAGRGGQMQPIANRMWHSGFLPGQFQGVHLRSKGDPVLYLSSPSGVTHELQREVIETAQKLNRAQQQATADPEIATRIQQYELAFKMQTSVPRLTDISDEPQHVRDLYGVKGADGSYAYNCLLARRLAERGVRFIQLYHRDWDHHGNIKNDIRLKAEEVDGPTAALIADLRMRGMLDETLILWGGEFGRTPMSQGGSGRDHHMKAFSMVLCGGGIRGGLSYGATDEFGYHAVQDRVHVNDLHATILHLLGIDHTRLTVRTQGRDFRLTDVAGVVVRAILR